MHIYGTSPSDMRVYFSGQELTNGEKTVAELGIAPNSLLVVKVRQHLANTLHVHVVVVQHGACGSRSALM